MTKTKLFLCLGVLAEGFAVVLAGCGGDGETTFSTTSSSASSSSSGGEGGAGGAGGSAGAGGIMATGGAGGMGGGMAGAGGGGLGGMGGMGGGGPTCAKPTETCGGCLYDQCQLAYCDCANEPACFALIGCLEMCPPNMPDCPSGCIAANSTGFAEFTIASSCSGTLCAPSCPGSDPVKPCDLCLSQKCEMQLETCLASAQCFPLIDCRKQCNGNMACEQQCDAMYPNGVPLVQALFICAGMGCGPSCN